VLKHEGHNEKHTKNMKRERKGGKPRKSSSLFKNAKDVDRTSVSS
jgi:hypothetical protein